jgi:hypothetical protein
MVLERWINHYHSRRPWYGLQPCRGKSAGVAIGPVSVLPARNPNVTIRNFVSLHLISSGAGDAHTASRRCHASIHPWTSATPWETCVSPTAPAASKAL